MRATIENLFRVYPSLRKSDRSKIVRTYCKETEKSDDTFSRRLRDKAFPLWEQEKLENILKTIYPKGFPGVAKKVA